MSSTSVHNTNIGVREAVTENSEWPDSHRYAGLPPGSARMSAMPDSLGRDLHRTNQGMNEHHDLWLAEMSNSRHMSMLLPSSFDAGAAIECHLCGMMLGSRILFQKHMNSIHRQAKALPFTCTKCQMGFFSMSGLQKHVEAHAGRRFSCEMCGARFTHKHHWKRHCINVHKLDYCV